MRQAQYREFQKTNIEPFILNSELQVTIKANIKSLLQFHSVCSNAKVFGKFINAANGEHTYRIEEPQYGEDFGGII
jgi:hypothetical protein